MKDEELMKVLIETNKNRENPVNEDLLKSILAIVINHPLEEERQKCQEKIRFLVNKSGVWKKRE